MKAARALEELAIKMGPEFDAHVADYEDKMKRLRDKFRSSLRL
jgi:hypothetical protein